MLGVLPLTPLVATLCIWQHANAFSSPPTTRAAPSASLSSTARNLFFGDYLPLGIPVLVAKDKWDTSRRTKLKERILSLASETKRGLMATDDQMEEMDGLFSQLEKLNPTVNPITNKLSTLSGDWSLDYTTSGSILGKGGSPRIGPIIQNIDTAALSAKNSEIIRYGGIINVSRSVSAALSPVNGKLTDVKFKKFMVGPLGFDAPDSARGQLEITYLDDEVRLTRGDKGNIFVLTRM
eukprot:CAMPEP_0172559126 /NCGR_PEP_ID=MMETSP1067-20121228/82727_1 /TAXON_ID=265564 ORGANISM="Thalassiosira punctigera, Strain Tpunct2005C2" /NCGR_SAMPLE_ID=MMETSP1067 /ASSEMBLY_ACC=CAM_ASM_000444 /LENGTH=236 /DNA_ID=CAMNT_0013348655 /DNA_START=18 /DNA_END=728 /DNA_ORIENTATION=+